jgi:hypothetical protein
MAKKKTAGSDATDTSSRRRAAKRPASSAGQDAVSASVSPSTDPGSAARTVDTAADMARVRDLAAAPADASGNGSSSSDTTSGSQQSSSYSDVPSSDAAPSYDQIAEAAYHRYLRRGAEHGRDFEDWVEAERELKQR